MVERDPGIVVRWLGDRVDPGLLPSRSWCEMAT
jgi:hypothetical protein